MGCPVRILHVVVNMNRGGAETLIMNLYRNIDRSKVQFDFLTCKEGVFDSEIESLGGKVYRIPYVNDVGHFRYIRALDYFFNLHQEYSIVHSHMDKMSGLVLRSAKKAGVNVRVAHSHSTRSEGGIAKRVYKWYAAQFILPSATHLFACSNKAAEWLFSNKVRVKILKNGIEPEKFTFCLKTKEEVRKELNIPLESFVIGHVGRFDKPKNHTFLIDIFNQIIKGKQEDSILVLIGDGLLRSEIEKKVVELNLSDQVRFLGIRGDVSRLLQSFDVFLFPSLHEGLPVTLIEAQGSGLPCLISDVITNEVDMMAGLVNYESLNSLPKLWAEKLFKMIHLKDRVSDISRNIKKNGYDIRDSADWLQNFYTNTAASFN